MYSRRFFAVSTELSEQEPSASIEASCKQSDQVNSVFKPHRVNEKMISSNTSDFVGNSSTEVRLIAFVLNVSKPFKYSESGWNKSGRGLSLKESELP